LQEDPFQFGRRQLVLADDFPLASGVAGLNTLGVPAAIFPDIGGIAFADPENVG
jgi:hypothetical protein